MNFDDELRQAMRRVDAPERFAAKVAARAVRPSPSAVLVPPRTSHRWWLAAGLAASLAAAVGGSVALLEQRRAAEGRQARDQALQALRLASAHLNEIHARVAAHTETD